MICDKCIDGYGACIASSSYDTYKVDSDYKLKSIILKTEFICKVCDYVQCKKLEFEVLNDVSLKCCKCGNINVVEGLNIIRDAEPFEVGKTYSTIIDFKCSCSFIRKRRFLDVDINVLSISDICEEISEFKNEIVFE